MKFCCLPSFLFLFLLRVAAAGVGEFSIPDVSPLGGEQLQRLREIVASDEEAKVLVAEVLAEARPFFKVEPRPLPKIHYEGLVNTDPRRIATVERISQMREVAFLVRHWQVTGDVEVAATLKRLILAWASVCEPTGNDVNDNKFYPLLVAYLALRDSLYESRRKAVDIWVAEIGRLHEQAVKTSEHFTNRYSKSVRLLAIAGMILGREDWVATAEAGVKKFVRGSLFPDGTSRDLKHRDSLTYHGSALKPPMELAMLGREKGMDLYAWESPRGGSLKKSVEFMVPFAMGEKTRKEWLNTKVELDRRRSAAGLEKYRAGRLYEPKDALEVMEYASYFDPGLMRVVRHLREKKAERFPTWRTLVNAAARPPKKEKDLREALREFDLQFDESFAWWGKIYDPASGGFFYSLSSRRNEKFGPFIEATAKAVHVLNWTGMMEETSPKFRDGLIGYFQSRQNAETGFFRDPDYQKQYRHNTLTRALGMSIHALESIGSKPLHPHPLARTDDNAEARKHYDHYQSREAFSAWLKALPWERRSWTVGGRLRAELGVFNQLPAEKREVFLPLARKFIAAQQDANGYFTAPGEDWTSSLSGSYKIAAFLDGTDSEIPRKKEMLATTLDHLFHSDYQNTIVLYNTASMLNILARNGEKYDLDLRVKIIRRCTAILKTMRAPDGGFVTRIGQPAHNQNGFTLAEKVIESNTNATGLAHKARMLLIEMATGKEAPHPHSKSGDFLKALPR